MPNSVLGVANALLLMADGVGEPLSNMKLQKMLYYEQGYHLAGNINVFQFGLYTDKARRAGREDGVKAPRVFCMLGYNGVVYPLLYDPYHEMYKC